MAAVVKSLAEFFTRISDPDEKVLDRMQHGKSIGVKLLLAKAQAAMDTKNAPSLKVCSLVADSIGIAIIPDKKKAGCVQLFFKEAMEKNSPEHAAAEMAAARANRKRVDVLIGCLFAVEKIRPDELERLDLAKGNEAIEMSMKMNLLIEQARATLLPVKAPFASIEQKARVRFKELAASPSGGSPSLAFE